MANVMSMKNLRNKVSRNGFDMSERRAFTAKVGEILPCFTLEVIPGDSVNINPAHFTRTMPVNTAAYTQIKEYVHYYFVPYRLIHSGFDAYFLDLEKNPTRASSIRDSARMDDLLPYLSTRSIADYIYNMAQKKLPNVAGMDHATTACKLLEYLGYGDFTKFLKQKYSDTQFASWSKEKKAELNQRLSPLFLMAYQKIYQDYFRNKQWEQASPQCCNMDYQSFGVELPIAVLVPTLNDKTIVNDMFSLRYCEHNKDYFFGLLPNAQYGDFATIPVDIKEKATVGINGMNTQNLAGMFNLSASVIALRKAEALQKYREIKQSGDQDYKSYLQKIFNVNVSDDRSDKCRYLGGYDGQIQISEVVNTNLSADESITDIKGKGLSQSGTGNIHFEAKEHGVIIGVYTARPMLSYSLDAPLKANTRVSLDDFANPVFDRIGMETVPLSEVVAPYTSVIGLSNNLPVVNAPLGYAPRYVSYKTNFDKIHGEFRNTLHAWVSPLSSKSIFNGLYKDVVDSQNVVYKLSYDCFKVRPNVVDSIFVVSADDTTATDQLLVNMGTGCPIVRNLDYDGLPY